MSLDLSTVSRSQLRTDTMLQHPIYLYQIRSTVTDDDGQTVGEVWDTDRVFATYVEAKAYGKGNQHNVDADDWRVYAVPCAGALRDLLERSMAP